MDFINQANTVLSRFNLADSVLKTHLFQSYRLSFYGGSLLCLSSSQIEALEVSYNYILHRIWSLPRVSHAAFIHLVAELKSVYNLLHCRLLKLVCKALNHDSILVHSVFQYSVHSCSNFIS